MSKDFKQAPAVQQPMDKVIEVLKGRLSIFIDGVHPNKIGVDKPRPLDSKTPANSPRVNPAAPAQESEKLRSFTLS